MVKAFQAVSNANFLGLRAFSTGPDFFGKRSLLLVCVSSRKSRRSVFRSLTRFCLALVQCILWPSLGLRLLLSFAHFLAFMIFLAFSTWY